MIAVPLTLELADMTGGAPDTRTRTATRAFQSIGGLESVAELATVRRELTSQEPQRYSGEWTFPPSLVHPSGPGDLRRAGHVREASWSADGQRWSCGVC